jgi:trimeric autotransporter adhesin
MKSAKLWCVTGVVLFTLLAIPVRLAAQQHPADGLSSLPLDAQPSVSATLGQDLPEYQAQARSGGFKAQNAQHKLAADFTSQGIVVRGGDIFWKMTFHGYGYGVVLTPPQTVVPTAKLNRIEYRRGSLTEWYVNGPAGLEQGFTITEPPAQADGQPLTIAFSLSKDLTAAVDENGRGLTLDTPDGKAGLRYTGLSAADAAGKKLPAWLEVQGEQLLLRVSDAGARYPVVIDPWVQLAELTASDGASGDIFGSSVSISGNTVVVGSPNSDNFRGAAYVFEKPERGWANMTQTAKLTASDGSYAKLGSSVSISGNTIVVGAPSQPVFGDSKPNDFQGAAYVFVKPANGWADMPPTARLTASDGAPGDFMGLSVGISGDTIVAGANQIDSGGLGAAYVFVRPSGGWTDMTETAELTASDGAWGSFFGFSVSIGRDTVVVGANNAWVNGRYQGAAYVFEKPESGWANMTQTAKLTASNASVTSNFGFSVSISGDTAVIGDPDEAVGGIQNQGAAYVFVRPASGWRDMNQTAELSVPHGKADVSVTPPGTRQSREPTPDNLGWSVFMSGNSVAAGAPGHNYRAGAAYVFEKPAGGWKTSSKFNAALTAEAGKKGDACGQSVSISGPIVLVGAYLATVGSNLGQGAAYLFGSETEWPTLSSGR